MSRFSNLEFEGQNEDAFVPQEEVVKDEAYYLTDAQRAFEVADFEQGLRLYARALEENPKSTAAWTVFHTVLPQRLILGGGLMDSEFELFAGPMRKRLACATQFTSSAGCGAAFRLKIVTA